MKKFLPHSETQGKMKSKTPISKQTIMYRMVSRRVILTPGGFAPSGARIGGRNGQASYASAGPDDQGLIAWETGIGSPQQPRSGGLRHLLLQQAYFFSDVAIVDVLAVNLGKFFKGDARLPSLLVCHAQVVVQGQRGLFVEAGHLKRAQIPLRRDSWHFFVDEARRQQRAGLEEVGRELALVLQLHHFLEFPDRLVEQAHLAERHAQVVTLLWILFGVLGFGRLAQFLEQPVK